MLTYLVIAVLALVAFGIALAPLMALSGLWAHSSAKANQAEADRILQLLNQR
jgi:hypothetical protein